MPAGQVSGIRYSLPGTNVNRKTFLQVPMREFWHNPGAQSTTFYVLIFKIASERLKWRNYVCSYISGTQGVNQHHFVSAPRHWFSGIKCGQFLRQRVPSTVHAAKRSVIM